MDHSPVVAPQLNGPLVGWRRLPTEKWILSSAVQKLIRRGRTDHAIKAALALHSVDPSYLPKRLPIIAFEDIGIGGLAACFDVLRIFGKQRFPTAVPKNRHAALVANLVDRLARSIKSRTACDILCLAHADRAHSKAAVSFAKSGEQCLIAMASDQSAALTSRALALHMLSGMSVQEGRWRRTLSPFNRNALSAVAEELHLPEIIKLLMVEGRNTVGLASMLPLAWEAATHASDSRIEDGKLRAERSICGLPAYSADMYTRVGKAAIAEFSRTLRQRHPSVFQGVPNARTHSRLVGMAIFHAEGSKLDRWLENAAITGHREQIERAELQALGLPDVASHAALYRMLEAEHRLLWDIRQAHLRAAFGKLGVPNG